MKRVLTDRIPIFECEEVYVVVIRKPQGLDNQPVSVAISGIYNDYGRIKFLDDAPLFVAYNQRRVEPLTYETLNPLFEEENTVYFLKEQTDEII